MAKYHTVESLIKILQTLPRDSVILMEDPTNGEFNPISSLDVNSSKDRDEEGDPFYPCPRGEFTGTVILLRTE